MTNYIDGFIFTRFAVEPSFHTGFAVSQIQFRLAPQSFQARFAFAFVTASWESDEIPPQGPKYNLDSDVDLVQ